MAVGRLLRAAALAALLASAAGGADDDRVVVKEIRTFGNARTSRGVILHYCEFRPGDVLTEEELARRIRRTEQNLRNTQFFSRLRLFDLPRSNPREAVIMIDVAEGTDWHLSASTWQAELRRENIGGDAVTVGAEFGWDLQRLYYRQPWIFDQPLEVGASAFYENGHETIIENEMGYAGEWFHHEAAGGESYLGYLINLRTRFGLGVSGEYFNYYDWRFKIDPPGRFGVQPEAHLVALRPYAEWDNRDDDLYPRRGFYLAGHGELSADALSDYEYRGVEGELRGYVSPGADFVFAGRIRAGAQSEMTPYVRRLSIRGADGLRNASSYRTIGTRALLLTGELRRPLFPSPIFSAWFEGVFFVDAGRAWDPGEAVKLEAFDYAFGPGLRVHMRSPFYFDWRAELNVFDGFSFYATARRAF